MSIFLRQLAVFAFIGTSLTLAHDDDKKAKGSKDGESPSSESTKVSVVRSSSVMRLGATPSRDAPVFEVVASIGSRPVHMGVDTLAGVSCVGRADVTQEQW